MNTFGVAAAVTVDRQLRVFLGPVAAVAVFGAFGVPAASGRGIFGNLDRAAAGLCWAAAFGLLCLFVRRSYDECGRIADRGVAGRNSLPRTWQIAPTKEFSAMTGIDLSLTCAQDSAACASP